MGGRHRHRRIGLIIPSSNTTMEVEFTRHLPEGVSVHSARVHLERVTVEELEGMAERVEEAALLLGDARVDLIVYGCTTGSLIKGKGYDLELERRIEGATGIPALATAHAVLEALKERGLKRIVVATPYIAEVNEKEREFLLANGLEVVAIRGLGLLRNQEIGLQEPRVVYKLGEELMEEHPEAEGLFISCTNLRTFEVLRPLEDELRKPVISSNQATLWQALKKIDMRRESP
ncbi:TPA: maleate cis-trans isomerase [Candidatus Bipolaricaulota bacterium]|nr:maleate cis-trans isomerase [Candidatus Bipolaricaulota bacterium]